MEESDSRLQTRVIVHSPEHLSTAKGITVKLNDTVDSLKKRIGQELFPALSETPFVLLCHGAELVDLDFLRDLDHVYIKLSGSPEASCKPDLPFSDEYVMLNVGGRQFVTSRSTLTIKAPSGMLAKMLASEEEGMSASKKDSNGAYLIDRSPDFFKPILHYLRTGQLLLDQGINPEGVYHEAKFYGVDALLAPLESMMSLCKPEEIALTRRDVINAIIATPSNLQLRFQGVNMAGANLSKLDLRNINFKYAVFKNCDLRTCNLSYCNFERADLSGACLDGAQLLGVRMVCANLEKASMQKCTFDDPSGSLANMEGVNLRSANLEGSNMAGVNLRVATIKYGNMQNCDLRLAVLAGADLEQCNLSGSDLQLANLRGANLKDTVMEFMMTPLHMSQTIR